MLIYSAGPLLSEAEKRFNLRLTERLEGAGFRVFLLQRDGLEGSKPPYDRMNREERRRVMCSQGRDQLPQEREEERPALPKPRLQRSRDERDAAGAEQPQEPEGLDGSQEEDVPSLTQTPPDLHSLWSRETTR